jgi:hypothetical protein
MAALYGRMKGNRGEVTRCGTKDSGIHSSLETWTGCIHTVLRGDGSYTVFVSPKYGGPNLLIADGKLDDDLDEINGSTDEQM